MRADMMSSGTAGHGEKEVRVAVCLLYTHNHWSVKPLGFVHICMEHAQIQETFRVSKAMLRHP